MPELVDPNRRSQLIYVALAWKSTGSFFERSIPALPGVPERLTYKPRVSRSSRRDQSISHCLVPTPHYSVPVMPFESRLPSESSGRSPRIPHRNILTEKAWENAV